MAIKNENFEMWQGEDFLIVFNIKDENNVPKILTGGKALFVIIGTGISKTMYNGITIEGNQVKVMLSLSDTRNLVGQYEYELRIWDANDFSKVSTKGRIHIFESHTLE